MAVRARPGGGRPGDATPGLTDLLEPSPLAHTVPPLRSDPTEGSALRLTDWRIRPRGVVGIHVGVTLVLLAVVGASAAWMPQVHRLHSVGSTGVPSLDGWMHWDAAWYLEIARSGYSYHPRVQSSVAFFPLYPTLMHAVTPIFADPLVGGVVITWVCGLVSGLLFWKWLGGHVTGTARTIALLLLLLFPYAYYLYGAVYSDALFLACALASFVLLESDHPLLAGCVGALGASARPVGILLTIGLSVRALELYSPRVTSKWSITHPSGPNRRRRAVALVAVGLSAGGFAAYCLYLGVRFGDPLAFARAQQAWGHTPTFSTVLKVPLVHEVRHMHWPFGSVRYLAAPVATIAALALVPSVFRRLGAGYGVYALLVVAVPALTTGDLFSMGRFVLAAFPCFAVAGALLATRRHNVVLAVLVASSALLLLITSLFARGYYLA